MFLSLVRQRRSIRKFMSRPVEDEKIEQLMEAALRSPSSMGNNPWEFVVVTDRDLLERLSRAKPHGASFLKNAPLGIAVCADPAKSTVWIEDASIASLVIHLSAHSLGLGSCWIQLRGRMYDDTRSSGEVAAALLEIPGPMEVLSIVAIGYADEEKPSHPETNLPWEKIHVNTFGKSYWKKGI
jgi:nitroreductase